MKNKIRLLTIVGNVMLIITCIFQMVMDLNSTIFTILVGTSIFLELIGITLDKEK